MKFYFIIIVLATLPLIFNTASIYNGQQSDNMKTYPRRTDLTDVTNGLSDADIDAALNDLSLYDLNMLSKLIDATNVAEYDYKENGFLNSIEKSHPFDGDGINLRLDNSAADDMNCDENNYNDFNENEQQGAQKFNVPSRAITNMDDDNQIRAKRENVKQEQEITVDEEYIKELENSFPRDQDQNNNDFNEDKKEHVRVKRN